MSRVGHAMRRAAAGVPVGGEFDFHAGGLAFLHSWLADDVAAGATETWSDGGTDGSADLKQTTGPLQPTAAADSGPNSQPGVRSDGVDDLMSTVGAGSILRPESDGSGLDADDRQTLMVVVKTFSDTNVLLDALSGSSGHVWFVSDTIKVDMTATRTFSGNTYPAAGEHLLVIQYQAGTVDRSTVWLNGVEDTSSPQVTTATSNQLTLFNRAVGGNPADIVFSFAGFINHTAATTHKDLTGYDDWVAAAETKWGLSIA